MKHIKAFTYKEKIPDVRAGKCGQTIRPKGIRPVSIGDTILFHGWAGIPYRSRWDWRLEIIVNVIKPILVYYEGIVFLDSISPRLVPWIELDMLAKEDGIKCKDNQKPGIIMGNLFNSMYKLPMYYAGKSGLDFQIIRWKIPKVIE